MGSLLNCMALLGYGVSMTFTSGPITYNTIRYKLAANSCNCLHAGRGVLWLSRWWRARRHSPRRRWMRSNYSNVSVSLTAFSFRYTLDGNQINLDNIHTPLLCGGYGAVWLTDDIKCHVLMSRSLLILYCLLCDHQVRDCEPKDPKRERIVHLIDDFRITGANGERILPGDMWQMNCLI